MIASGDHLRVVVLTTTQGLATVQYLAGHLNVVGVVVDFGPWPSRKPRSLLGRAKRLVRGRLARDDVQPSQGDRVTGQQLAAQSRVEVVHVRNINDPPAQTALRQWEPDLGIMAGGRIMRRCLFEEGKIACCSIAAQSSEGYC